MIKKIFILFILTFLTLNFAQSQPLKNIQKFTFLYYNSDDAEKFFDLLYSLKLSEKIKNKIPEIEFENIDSYSDFDKGTALILISFDVYDASKILDNLYYGTLKLSVKRNISIEEYLSRAIVYEKEASFAFHNSSEQEIKKLFEDLSERLILEFAIEYYSQRSK